MRDAYVTGVQTCALPIWSQFRGGNADRNWAPPPAQTASAPPTTSRGWGGAGRGPGNTDIGQLFQHAAIQRHDVEVIGAYEADTFAVLCEVRVALHIGSLGKLTGLAGGVVEDEEVARAGVSREALVPGGIAQRRRRQLDRVVGKLAQPAPVAVHRIGVHGGDHAVGVPLPLEVEHLAVVRPAGRGWFV